MTLWDVQALLAALGLYKGAIDGDLGPKTWEAVRAAERDLIEAYSDDPDHMKNARRILAAGQVALVKLGFESGAVDGYAGRNTREALTKWRSTGAGAPWRVDRTPKAGSGVNPAQKAFPRQADLAGFYGPAGGPRCTRGRVRLPVPFALAWDRSQKIESFACHEAVAEPMARIFHQAVDHYGPFEFDHLGLSVFGGCFNYRKMRGGDALSTHAWGIAVDLNPEKNRLRWRADRAQFARPAYEPFWQIVAANGAVSAGHAWGADWMHFQFARL